MNESTLLGLVKAALSGDRDARLQLSDRFSDCDDEETAQLLRGRPDTFVGPMPALMVTGTVKVKALVFERPDRPGEYYVVEAHRSDWLDFETLFNQDGRHQRATGVDIDGADLDAGTFWLCYVEDCHSPPCAVVYSEYNSYEIGAPLDAFVNALPWARIEEPDLADYYDVNGEPKDPLEFTDSGVPYDSESIAIHLLRLVRIITEENQ